ncbi:hypothetical protein KM043_001623 [Ampulex compressa]|nr:hypothetical protein KM043_001623 [Ampulex compressa]
MAHVGRTLGEDASATADAERKKPRQYPSCSTQFAWEMQGRNPSIEETLPDTWTFITTGLLTCHFHRDPAEAVATERPGSAIPVGKCLPNPGYPLSRNLETRNGNEYNDEDADEDEDEDDDDDENGAEAILTDHRGFR